MDHVVYLDFKAKEMDLLLTGKKTMVIRGGTGRKIPYGRVRKGDMLYFINNNGEGILKACAEVSSTLHSDKMDKNTSIAFINEYKTQLALSPKQFKKWAGKRYLVLIEVIDIKSINPFMINKGNFQTMDDWLLVENIDKVRL